MTDPVSGCCGGLAALNRICDALCEIKLQFHSFACRMACCSTDNSERVTTISNHNHLKRKETTMSSIGGDSIISGTPKFNKENAAATRDTRSEPDKERRSN